MIVKMPFPDCFIPEEREFQMYCAIKLFKGKYINLEDAIKMCGYSEINELNKSKFNELCILFEKRYKKLCGDGYSDWVFRKDPKDNVE